jgi:cytochrome c biogenesis protein CcmG/thiol:disulfide interchange protein DsbE
METRTTQRKLNKNQFVPLVLIGSGLIILGLLLARVLMPPSPSDEYSVVPSTVNFPAPELVLNDLNGNKVNIADYRQQIVMINNWATWCPPCKAEMPTLNKYFKAHSGQGFMLFGVNAGDPTKDVANYVNDYGLTFPVLLDPNTRTLSSFRNDALPSSYVIDHNGNVILAWTGPISRDMLEKYITPLLEQ